MEDTRPKHTVNFFGFLIAFIGALLFSTKAVIVKKAFADVHADALTLLALRMLFSLPFYVLTAFIISSNKSNRKMTTKEWIAVFLLGMSDII
jgi:drug/metabolite transporter (DMT)-like permease